MYFLLMDYRNTGKRVGINLWTLSGITADDHTYFVTAEPGIKEKLERINATLFLYSQNYVRKFEVLPEDFKGSKHDLMPYLYRDIEYNHPISNPFVIYVGDSLEKLLQLKQELLDPYENPYDRTGIKTVIDSNL